ncbi:histidine phosphatase family protein, partial [Actinotalea fermentans ATCC 43279 = JCM 9966 = DSM 3133]
MTLTLTLVRHGQTVLNARRHLQGACDSPLTRTGRAGVRVTAQHLSRHEFDAAYSSPQGRAVLTAIEILRHHPDLRLSVDEDLRELSFGTFERRPERELDAVVPWSTLVPAVLAGTHPGIGGGEPGAAFMARVRAVLGRIVAAHDDAAGP